MLDATTSSRSCAEDELEVERKEAVSRMREWKVHQLWSNLSIQAGLPFSSSLYRVTVCVHVKEVSIDYIFSVVIEKSPVCFPFHKSS